MKIAITAANGQLGSSIINKLEKEVGKQNIVGIVRTPEKATHLGVEIRKGDYSSRDDYNSALKGINKVLLISGMDDPKTRIQQHRNVIEAAKENDVKKIVYTSIVGAEDKNAFSPIVQSNRQTEKDIRDSGLEWSIGRNGIYIEPDLEYIENYILEGEIRNCAGTGKCSYTSREELACAYSKMIFEEKHNGKLYNLVGDPITQTQLANYVNEVYGTDLIYNSISVERYTAERKEELGEFIGTVIAGIYEGIRNGANYVRSDFEKATGRQHKSIIDMIKSFNEKQ